MFNMVVLLEISTLAILDWFSLDKSIFITSLLKVPLAKGILFRSP